MSGSENMIVRLKGSQQQFERLIAIARGREMTAQFREAIMKRLAYQLETQPLIDLDALVLWEDQINEHPKEDPFK